MQIIALQLKINTQTVTADHFQVHPGSFFTPQITVEALCQIND